MNKTPIDKFKRKRKELKILLNEVNETLLQIASKSEEYNNALADAKDFIRDNASSDLQQNEFKVIHTKPKIQYELKKLPAQVVQYLNIKIDQTDVSKLIKNGVITESDAELAKAKSSKPTKKIFGPKEVKLNFDFEN